MPRLDLALAALLLAPAVLFAHGGVDDGHSSPTPTPTPTPTPVVKVSGGKKQVTRSARHVLRGSVAHAELVGRVLVRVTGRTRAAALQRGRWRITLRVGRGRHAVSVWAALRGSDRTTQPLRITLIRRAP